MRRSRWLVLGLALSAAAVPAARGAAETTSNPSAASAPSRDLGRGPAYRTLARLAVLHAGRVKPLDTMAREDIRQIFGRETVKLVDPAQGNKVVETWGPTAALYDWSVRPEFWDDQPIILVDYLPLKRALLAESIRTRLEPIEKRVGTTLSAPDRDALHSLMAGEPLSEARTEALTGHAQLSVQEKRTLAVVAAELSEDHKWLTPRQVEEATVRRGEQELPFLNWFGAVMEKKQEAQNSINGEVRLDDMEKRGQEVGFRLLQYQTLRDRSMRRGEPMRVMPRPSNTAYLTYLGKVVEKARKGGSADDLAPFELDTLKALDTYWGNLAGSERKSPGTDAKADRKLASWLATSSAWVPLKALLDTKPETLVEAGYPEPQVRTFLDAFKALDDAEDTTPGSVDPARTEALVRAARALGESVSAEAYPSVRAISRETYFNASSPFWVAQWGYLMATLLLAACIGFMGFRATSGLGLFGRGLYALGLLGLVVGIGQEVLGFYLRVRISGWAPVTDMYETVIWVSLVAAVLGLVFEGIFRKVYAALAGSGVALLGTVLAANISLLDPKIHQLQPVLRSNYWLTIHVLTEVSSYGAFLLAAVLGLIASLYYLTATYRRSPHMLEVASPAIPGVPLLALGVYGIWKSGGLSGSSSLNNDIIFYGSYLVALPGGMLAIIGFGSMVGEIISRVRFRASQPDAGEIAGEPAREAEELQSHEEEATAAGGTATATRRRHSAAEIRARSIGKTPKSDPRTRAMQATAAEIKPLANFIYRTMQVGVLLIAAGTILGGVWADYSWGRFWGWDPKEVWALITLLIYLVPLHGRFAGWINTFFLVLASVVCSLSVIMAWYGVNFVLGVGLHSYGFNEGGGQLYVVAVCMGVVSVPLAAGWRRFLGSRVPVSSPV